MDLLDIRSASTSSTLTALTSSELSAAGRATASGPPSAVVAGHQAHRRHRYPPRPRTDSPDRLPPVPRRPVPWPPSAQPCPPCARTRPWRNRFRCCRRRRSCCCLRRLGAGLQHVLLGLGLGDLALQRNQVFLQGFHLTVLGLNLCRQRGRRLLECLATGQRLSGEIPLPFFRASSARSYQVLD